MIETTGKNDFEYFASIEDPNRLGDHILGKVRTWREWCASRGLLDLWRKKLSNYYGMSAGGNSSQSLTRGGSEGELTMIKINDLHSLLQEQLVVVTGQRPAGQARAINSDTESLKNSKIASAICEYYMAESDFESKFVQAAEIALLCDESYVELYWDKAAGDPIAVDPETQKPVMSGDAILRIHCPWNVSRDPGLTVNSQSWHIITYRVNKFDMAESYPKFRDQILSMEKVDLPALPMDKIPDESDATYAHLLIHDRTSAVPNGRYTLMVGTQVVLDSALPYKDYPVDRMTPSNVIDGCTGYSSANDILAAEEVTDALHSIITTNEVTFGGQTIVGPMGANLNVSDLAKGVRYFELPPDMVHLLQPLQLTKTAPEIFQYIQTLNQKKERAVGSVQTSLAQQASQGASGSSMALIQTQSISYNSGTQRAYFRCLSGTMTKLIGMLRTYADTPRVARIVGKAKAEGLKEYKYTGDNLSSISSVVYEIVNPMSQTFGGRLTIAQDLLKAGMVKSGKQYINVVATGNLDVLTQDDEADGLLILEENEWLVEGRPFQAVITQMHSDHIKSHTSCITLEAQENDPEHVTRTLAHIQQHIDLWMQASVSNPGILLATGQQPLMPPQGMMPPQPGAPEGPGQMMSEMSPAEQSAETVQEPNLPNIAGTDQGPVIPGVTQ